MTRCHLHGEKNAFSKTPGGRFELPRCRAPEAFKAPAFPD
jgi:hypothetical protein